MNEIWKNILHWQEIVKHSNVEPFYGTICPECGYKFQSLMKGVDREGVIFACWKCHHYFSDPEPLCLNEEQLEANQQDLEDKLFAIELEHGFDTKELEEGNE
jgi:hypothetical protein